MPRGKVHKTSTQTVSRYGALSGAAPAAASDGRRELLGCLIPVEPRAGSAA